MSFDEVDDGDVLDLSELEKELAQLVDKSNVEELLKTQLSEFEMLSSMYSNPGELCVYDYSVVADINDFLDGKTTMIPSQLNFTINLTLADSNKLEICINLPLEYPNLEPDVFVRCEKLSRTQQHILNSNLGKYILDCERGETCVCSIISWLQENASKYFENVEKEIIKKVVAKSEFDCRLFSRLWVYSHHIYSKMKRRELLSLAQEFSITGFCLPGRPGIICVEGPSSDCEEWWQRVRCMSWKRIMLKKKEENELDETENYMKLRKFSTYQEVLFEGPKVRGRDCHMDFGEFYKYLEEHGCEHVFKDFFGVDGRTSALH